MKLSNIKIYWPYFIFGAFIIVLIVNIAYIVIAEKTWRGVFTKNSYEKGINYNKTLEMIKQQEKLGIKIKTTIQPMGYNNYHLQTSAFDNSGKTIFGISVIYKFKYYPDPNMDFALIGIVRNSNYAYQDFSLPKVGEWELETAVSVDNNVIQDIKYVNLKPQIENEF